MNLINPNDRFAIFGARGMAGSAICRALDRAGYQVQLKPSCAELHLLDPVAIPSCLANITHSGGALGSKSERHL